MQIRLIKKAEACRRFDISRPTLDKIIKEGKITEYFAPSKNNKIGWIHSKEIETFLSIEGVENPIPEDLLEGVL